MTSSCHPSMASASGSQVRGDASPSDYAWFVNFNNGNSNYNNRDNHNRVRAVRGPAREFQGAECQIEYRTLYDAWRRAGRNKVPSANQLGFDHQWADNLLDLQEQLTSGQWSPHPSTCFIATRPKAREIHAPDFADRVVHHWLVPQLEAIYENGFIHDSYANRKGKGSHAAVKRLQQFVRQVHSGQDGGYFLQLDIHNFFNQVHRPTLYGLLKAKIARRSVPLTAQHVVYALLRRSPLAPGVTYRATASERAQVPPHKRLENAPAGCGLPIGNLSSQFFANVYLNELDQFAKHVLKAKRYLRYVDDFVLVHHDRAQLEQWLRQIEQFLADKLRLTLKPDIRLRPLSVGIDFLGYVVRPTHTTVRRRVVSHANEALSSWAHGRLLLQTIRATPDDFRRVRSVWASYQGHFGHANSHRLTRSMLQRFPWLASAAAPRSFSHALEGRPVSVRRGGK